MKVLVLGSLASSLVNFRGSLLKAMSDAGHEVSAWAGDPDPQTLRWLNQHHISFRKLPLARARIQPTRDLQLFLYLTHQIRKLQPDVVFAYTIKPIVYGSMAAHLAGVPRIFSMVTGLGYTLSEPQGLRRLLQKKLVSQLYRKSLSHNHRVFFQNPDDLDFFLDENILPCKDRACWVHGSGVDLTHFKPTPVPVHPLRFLLIARLLYDKGINEYVQAARMLKRRHPQVRFGLLGPLDTHPNAIPIRSIEQWQREGILEYYGLQDDVRPYLAQSSVCVLPSYREGTPRSVLEAMAMNRPVITTQAPGCRETVRHGYNGFLVPTRTVRPLAAAMERFIHEPALVEPMGQASLQLARQKFDVRNVNRILLKQMELS